MNATRPSLAAQPTVTVGVRYFAGMRASIGVDDERMSFPVTTDTQHILDTIAARHPQIAAWCRVSRVAVGDRFVRGSVTLSEGDDICIIPPVSGG